MLRIQNNSGEWWTESCWGVEQAAERYDTVEDLPLSLDDLDQEIFDDNPQCLDIRYYAEEAKEAEASVICQRRM